MQFDKSKLIKSPLNYVGGKFKLLPQILPLFPNKVDTFIDLFAGGCNVGANVEAKRILLNDAQKEVIELVEYLYKYNVDFLIGEIEGIIHKYKLNAWKKEPYLKLREDYNKGSKSPMMFYTLIAHSFSNQIRFNRKGEFNMPVGKRTFNPQLRKRFVTFVENIKNKSFIFKSNDFRSFNFELLNQNDFVYCDPPYLITLASYNENDGWNETKEKQLLSILDKLNDNGIKFALSNVFENKGKVHNMLIEWANKYNIHNLNNTYGNCNYQAKDKSKNTTKEVLITNY